MDNLTLLDMFKHGTATWSAVSSFVVVLFWCVGCWLAFIAIVNYKNAADGKSGIAKPIIQTVIAALNEAGLHEKTKILVGGAPITAEYARQIGADGYAEDAAQAVRVARQLVEA